MRRDEAFLLDMVIHARFPVDMARTYTLQAFIRDKKLQLSAQKALEIIGEASRKVSKEYKQSHTNIPWHDWIELRNTFVHQYFRIDIAELWEGVNQISLEVIDHIEPLIPPAGDTPDTGSAH